MMQNVGDAIKIWVKELDALKIKTIWSKKCIVARDQMKFSINILKLHREVFLTSDIYFVNKIIFFLTVIRKLCFTDVNHLANQKFPEIFHAFKDIYMYYLKRGFRIIRLHVDGEFAPLKTLIEFMPAGPMVNLASRNEHVPEIERRIRVVK